MAGLLLALIVIAAFGLLLVMLEGDDWSRMRHGHLPRPSMGAVGPWMRDVLPWMKADAGSAKPEPVRQEAQGTPAVRDPQPAEPPAVAEAPERSVEASVYDRLYGPRRSVRREQSDD